MHYSKRIVESRPKQQTYHHPVAQVCDEESVQNKSFHYLFSFCGLRGGTTPDICHWKWNSFRRAIKSTSLNVALMKLTIAANYGHGNTIGGERRLYREEYLKAFLEKQPMEYFEELASEISADRGTPSDELDGESAHVPIADYLDSPLIKNRGTYVTGLRIFFSSTCHNNANNSF